MILVHTVNHFVVIEVSYTRKIEPIILPPCLDLIEMYLDIGIWPMQSQSMALPKIFPAGTSGEHSPSLKQMK